MFYSFVTLPSLGGGLVPVSRLARSLTISRKYQRRPLRRGAYRTPDQRLLGIDSNRIPINYAELSRVSSKDL
jgi:hypothetical protein